MVLSMFLSTKHRKAAMISPRYPWSINPIELANISGVLTMELRGYSRYDPLRSDVGAGMNCADIPSPILVTVLHSNSYVSGKIKSIPLSPTWPMMSILSE